MTTIAFKDGVMAADSLVVSGSCSVGSREKLVKIGVSIVGAAGDLSAVEEFLTWVKVGRPSERPNFNDQTDFGALISEPNGFLEFDWRCRAFSYKHPFAAIGSGALIAIGAMAHGASAVEAVEIACQFDMGSGLPVTFME